LVITARRGFSRVKGLQQSGRQEVAAPDGGNMHALVLNMRVCGECSHLGLNRAENSPDFGFRAAQIIG
jgi:hypothetical protein